MVKIIIPVHSMVDLITNSSTELFVLDTEKSVNLVKEILVEAVMLHNSAHGTNVLFEDIFSEPYLGSGKEALGDWGNYGTAYSSAVKCGIILFGANDNSIPYWMQEFISDVFGFNTERHHLG